MTEHSAKAKHLGQGYIEVSGLDPDGVLYAKVPVDADGHPGEDVLQAVLASFVGQWARLESRDFLRLQSAAQEPPAELTKGKKPEAKPEAKPKADASDQDIRPT